MITEKIAVMTDNYVVTIGREPGSGGHEIGKKLAEKLGFSFYDKELINIASQKSGLGKEFFEKADECYGPSLYGGLFGMRNSLVDEVYAGYYLSNENFFKIQSDVIRDLAEKSPAVFVGRCADYVLKNHPRCFNIFITAELTDRIKRLASIHNVDEEKAKKIVDKMDKKRSEYYNFYSNKQWGIAKSYHLCVNSSVTGIQNTVDLITDYINILSNKQQ